MIYNILKAVFFFTIISIILAIFLSFFSFFLSVKKEKIIKKIDNLLPQTQCGQCGYPGCYPYAKSIFQNKENIDRCVPGGKKTYLKIAKILKVSVDYNCLKHKKFNFKDINYTIYIDELNCIGCSKCLDSCPVDAIVGSFGYMHTILQKFCTSCEICISVCPMNCIKKKEK
ncbi:RnfABCDGE type electron transport complex subunit B [Buchnera aphidicola (Mindarus keteleerifoliae)]|uniref:RnfABCDGE type electron transport complex subunit B n=1 Tax=Buchnera aphidicola TaxID=9 RepID=UPI0031B6A995